MSILRGNISVVLVEPSLPENVGSVARVMNNMGVADFRLVKPCDHLCEKARQLASNSEMVLEGAKTFSSLEEAVTDRQIVIATTARERSRTTTISNLPDIHDFLSGKHESKIAIVFGRESSGLTNAEMSVCNHWIHIPTFGGSGSFNLSHAVAVVLYEISKTFGEVSRENESTQTLATSQEVEGLKSHLFEVLNEVGFLKENQEETIQNSFSDLIARANLTPSDTKIVRGFLHRIEVTLKRARHDKDVTD